MMFSSMTRNRGAIVAFRNFRLDSPCDSPDDQETGWAHYPAGFFGKWMPNSKKARESMSRPKRITFASGIGWVFAIEERAALPGADSVGRVFKTRDCSEEITGPEKGMVGFLATMPNKRVRVVYGE